MASDGSNKKIRKPYTITKSRESWTDEEHDKFLEALQLFDRDWKKIEDFVGSKTVIQIRSHAQKYFLKVQKNGSVAHVPPPRPKRKAAHPYPQKAYKNEDTEETDTMRITSHDFSCLRSSTQTSSNDEIPSQRIEGILHHGIPDFGEVYTFIGNVFDPHTKGHMQKLKEMDPINVETVLLLMKNLTINMANPDFEKLVLERQLLPSNDANAKDRIGAGYGENENNDVLPS